MKKKLFLVSGLILLIFFISLPVLAAGLVPCGNEGEPMCTFGDLLTLVNNVIQFALFNVAVPIGVIWIIVGGFLMMTAGGNKGRFEQGKSYIKGVVIALLISFSAWLIVDTVISFLNIKK